MTDRITPSQRSANMAKIRGRDTRPELLVRKAAHAAGMRYRLHRRGLPGTPDLIFPKAKVAVFVHGCFWHRHPNCPNCTSPKTRPDFWQAKFDTNVARDIRTTGELIQLGWKPWIIWECEAEQPQQLESAISDLRRLCHSRISNAC